MTRATLRLELDVTYDVTDDTNIEDLRDRLLDLATQADYIGQLTEDTDATVVIINPSVRILK